MNAQEIRDLWVEGEAYGRSIAVKAELAAQVAELTHTMRIFVMAFTAATAASAEDPTYVAQKIGQALETLRRYTDEDQKGADNAAPKEQPIGWPQQNRAPHWAAAPQTTWGGLAGGVDHVLAKDPASFRAGQSAYS